VNNQLQHLALGGMRRHYRLWTEAGLQVLEQLALPTWTARRQDLDGPSHLAAHLKRHFCTGE
jgi:hypothetical protein